MFVLSTVKNRVIWDFCKLPTVYIIQTMEISLNFYKLGYKVCHWIVIIIDRYPDMFEFCGFTFGSIYGYGLAL